MSLTETENVHLREALSIFNAAADNYIAALRLPPRGPVLIITDDLSNADSDLDCFARRQLSCEIQTKVGGMGHVSSLISFNDNQSYDEMFAGTQNALTNLQKHSRNNEAITVVYLGKKWDGRFGMYDAIAVHSTKTRKCHIGIGVDANKADIEVMAKMSAVKRLTGEKAIGYFRRFFRENPKGKLIYTTTDGNDKATLQLHYDTQQVPFAHDTGVLNGSDPHKIPSSDGKTAIAGGGNLLGMESFAAPYPFTSSSGDFYSKEGIRFKVRGGYLVAAEGWEQIYPELTAEKQRCLQVLEQRAKLASKHLKHDHLKVPLSEIGLGAFLIAGFTEIPSGVSTLTAEKEGPHLGIGHPVNTTPEHEEMSRLAEANEIRHDDWVLPKNTQIVFEGRDGKHVKFYPPA